MKTRFDSSIIATEIRINASSALQLMRYRLEEFREKHPDTNIEVQEASFVWFNRLYLLNSEREKQNADLFVKWHDALNEVADRDARIAILEGELNRLKKNLV